MKKIKHLFIAGLVLIIHLLILLSMYYIYTHSFEITHQTISEQKALKLSYSILIFGGFLGISTSLAGIYQLFLNHKLYISIPVTIFYYFPFLLLSNLYFYSFFILKGLL
jgi:hypothetical protein